MSFVADASAAAPWVLRDESKPETDHLYERALVSALIVPPLFFYEIRNLIIMNTRRGRMPPEDIMPAVNKIEEIETHYTGIVESAELVGYSLEHQLTTYDASYLAVAKAHGAPLATFDRALKRAALVEGVELLT